MKHGVKRHISQSDLCISHHVAGSKPLVFAPPSPEIFEKIRWPGASSSQVLTIRYLSDTYQIPIRYLSDTYQIPIRYLSDTYQIPIRVYQIPIRYLSESIRYLSDTYQNLSESIRVYQSLYLTVPFSRLLFNSPDVSMLGTAQPAALCISSAGGLGGTGAAAAATSHWTSSHGDFC